MANEKESFRYTYSADEQQELLAIREKYVPKEETMMDRLRRLDESTTKRGSVISMTVGTAGTLILGVGMTCTMVWGGELYLPGILIGLLGVAAVSAAYPLYKRVTERMRKKIAPEILRLTDELLR